MEKIRIGVIGPGLIWHGMHKNILKDYSEIFEVRAFCARKEKTLNDALVDYPGCDVYTDADEFLSQHLDAILVALPITKTGEMVKKVLRAGKNAFVEKPLAHNSELAREIIYLSEKTGKKVYVLENFAYKPIIQKMKEIIKEGKIGQPVYCDMRQHYVLSEELDDVNSKCEWRMNPEFPLGCFMDGGVHYVSAMTQLFGKPDALYASGTKQREMYGDYDHIITTFEYGDSLRVSFSQSGMLDTDKETIKIWGTKGYLVYELNQARLLVNDKEIAMWPNTKESHRAMWESLAESINANEEPLYSLKEALWAVEICEAIRKSLRRHLPVGLEK